MATLDEEEPQLLPTLKEYALFMPITGGALAVAFDVGFFYGLQSGYFTAFSLSEHLVSALYATPIALFILVLGTLELFVMARFRPQPLRTKRGAILILVFLAVLSCGFSIVNKEYVAAAAFGVISFVVMPIFFAKTKYQWQLTLLFAVPITGLCLSFTLGLSWSEAIISDEKMHSTIDMTIGPPMEGMVIRTGERGVLLYANKAFTLVPWANIRSVRNQF